VFSYIYGNFYIALVLRFYYYKPRATQKNGNFEPKTPFFLKKHPKPFQNETKK